jgi:hypothetical protein
LLSVEGDFEISQNKELSTTSFLTIHHTDPITQIMNSQINQQDENDKSIHDTEKKRETLIGGVDIAHTLTMNRCHGLCLEIMMLAVKERVCVLSTKNIALTSNKKGYETRG